MAESTQSRRTAEPEVDGAALLADLEALAAIGGEPETGGVHRVAYSPADLEARRWVSETLEALGATVRTDAIGNTIATYPGHDPAAVPLAIGSHTDTVPHGGRFDGALGVVAAIAVVRALRNADHSLRRPLEVLNFAAEEATMAGGTTGSQAMAGLLEPAILDKPAWDGRRVREHLVAAGLDPERLPEAARAPGSLAGYLELHIEQGVRLLGAANPPRDSVPIGVVTGFVGIRRYALVVEGEANHAGTTEMERRRDALVLAAPLVGAVDRLARDHGIVATVGSLAVHPGAPNVIPGRVDMIVEMRALDTGVLDTVARELRALAEAAGATFELVVDKPPVRCNETMIATVEAACRHLGYRALRLASGAGHDAMNLARLCPQTMIFVPSEGGVSHSPAERTTPEHCIAGARVLLASVLALDARERPEETPA